MRTILIDNHPATLQGLRNTLEEMAEIQVVGEATNAEEALRLARELRPGLVILDLELGEDSGLEACRELKSFLAPPYVLFYTAHNSTEDLAAMGRMEADGYFYKGLENEMV